MSRQFRGESVHKVDQKGRVSVPASFRRVLDEGDPDLVSGEFANFVLVYGFDDQKMIEGYTIERADEIAANISRMPRSSPNRQLAQRRYQAKSVPAQFDRNGRIVLSPMLREKIGITSEATFVGLGDMFEIWNPDLYTADEEELSERIKDQGSEEAMLAMHAEMDLYSIDRLKDRDS